MGWIIRILLILIILRIIWRLVMGPLRRPRHERRAARKSVPLVRDPVCGTYVVPERAIKAGAGDTAVFFCSEECRTRYQEGARA